MKSYLTRVRDKKIRNGCITLETKVVWCSASWRSTEYRLPEHVSGTYDPFFVIRGLNASAKSIDSCQPAQADMGRNFSLSLNFLCYGRPLLQAWLLPG